jgi:hypothetical protein
MTRFRELRRIERAIQHRDIEQLRWAEGYCQMRIGIATRDSHAKTWRQRLAEVQRELGGLSEKP